MGPVSNPAPFGLPKVGFSALAAEIARLQKEQEEQTRALEAERGKLAGQPRLAAEARARIELERITREKATLEAIYGIQSVALAATGAAEARAAESAAREAGMLDMTSKLLTLTKWLVAAAFLTLAAALVTLIIAT